MRECSIFNVQWSIFNLKRKNKRFDWRDVHCVRHRWYVLSVITCYFSLLMQAVCKYSFTLCCHAELISASLRLKKNLKRFSNCVTRCRCVFVVQNLKRKIKRFWCLAIQLMNGASQPKLIQSIEAGVQILKGFWNVFRFEWDAETSSAWQRGNGAAFMGLYLKGKSSVF